MKRNLIVSVSLIFLIVLMACLKNVWQGFTYFSLSFLVVLSVYWIVILVVKYIEDYYTYFEEDFKIYKAEMLNSTMLMREEFEQNENYYIKKYKRSQLRYKLMDIAKMLFLLVIIVISIVGMTKGGF